MKKILLILFFIFTLTSTLIAEITHYFPKLEANIIDQQGEREIKSLS